jgi:stage III sporulation protein AF
LARLIGRQLGKRGMHVIEWISGWLKQIIMIILIATFVDLLLPNTVLQRYVKVVVGMLILLTILSPITALLKEDLGFQRAQATMEAFERSSDRSAKEAGAKSMQTIIRDGEKIKSIHEKQSLRFVENRLGQMVKESIESRFSQPVHSVDVSTELDDEGNPKIKLMRIVLMQTVKQDSSASADSASEGDRSMTPVRPIQPIEPVSIQIEITGGTEADRQKTAASRPVMTEQMESTKQDITEMILQDWRISHSQLNVIYDLEIRH